MKKSKLLLALLLILLLAAFLSGCYVVDQFSDIFCCDALFFPLPIAVICIKLFGR